MAGSIIWKDCKQCEIVYETTNYEMFKVMPFNRDVLLNRVEKLIASFKQKRITNPIVVNEKCQVIDGQGRLETCKRLKLPVQFLVVPGATIDDCRRLNLYNTNWTTENFVNSHANAGNKNYIEIRKCRELTGLSYSLILRLANKGKFDSVYVTKLRSGQLNFTTQDTEIVTGVKQKADEILEKLSTSYRTNECFYTAVKVVVEWKKYNHNRMLAKCAQERHSYQQMSNLENQLKEFSRIYNARVKLTENKLYFEDYMRNKGYNVRDYKNAFPK